MNSTVPILSTYSLCAVPVTSGKWEFGNFENENSHRIPKAFAIVRYVFALIIRDLGIWEFGNDF
jgi:hypothetical protein